MAGVWCLLKFNTNLCSRGTGAPLQHRGSRKAQPDPGLAVAAWCCRISKLSHSFHLATETTTGDICNPTLNDLSMAGSSSSEISRAGSVFRESVDICLQNPFKSLVEITSVKKKKTKHQKEGSCTDKQLPAGGAEGSTGIQTNFPGLGFKLIKKRIRFSWWDNHLPALLSCNN